ncbi:MAG: glutamate--cysteine ligase [Pseudomonadota bacterium]
MQIDSTILQWLKNQDVQKTLRFSKRGIEKESLRVTQQGRLAQSPHPQILGSALTHPQITTDFSESLLEFITPACDSIQEAIDHLDQTHRFVSHHLPDQEMLWNLSMPCELPAEQDIPLARYGNSTQAQMKTIYREGLGLRYGRAMQTIAGVHYNFSLSHDFWTLLQEKKWQEKKTTSLATKMSHKDFISDQYFAMIRNFQRVSWLVIYLSGASPVCHANFVGKEKTSLEKVAPDTLGTRWATSLRMSDMGYHNNAQSQLHVCYNNIDSYIDSLNYALQTPYKIYNEIGLYQNQRRVQLNTNLLQIENEYYAPIRPKQPTLSGERPTRALKTRGVEYVEVRCLDIDPFCSEGVHTDVAHFVEILLIFCLLSSSPDISYEDILIFENNRKLTVNQGRQPNLELYDGIQNVRLHDWAISLLDQMQPIARILDEAYSSNSYSNALISQRDKVLHPETTPSAILWQWIENHQKSYLEFGIQLSKTWTNLQKQRDLSPEIIAQYHLWTATSLAEQKELESRAQPDLENYLADYFSGLPAMKQSPCAPDA